MKTLLIAHTAARLGISRRTVYYWLRAGRLQAVRFSRFQRVTVASIEAVERERAA